MELDLLETPIYDTIEIRGVVKVKTDQNFHLRAKNILIKGGTLQAGTAAAPYVHNGQITLYGKRTDPTIAIEN